MLWPLWMRHPKCSEVFNTISLSEIIEKFNAVGVPGWNTIHPMNLMFFQVMCYLLPFARFTLIQWYFLINQNRFKYGDDPIKSLQSKRGTSIYILLDYC